MATVLSDLRIGLSRILNDYISVDTTTDITTNNDIISTELKEYADNYFNDVYYVLILEGENIGVKRRVSDFTQSTGKLVVFGASLAAESAAVTFELHGIDPDKKKDALNEGAESLYPYLFQHKVDDTLMSHSNVREYTIPSTVQRVLEVYKGEWASPDIAEQILTNGDFENWTGSDADDWTATNITVAQESNDDFVLSGTYSAQCVVDATSIGTYYQSISSPTTYIGQRLSLALWIYCETASRVKAAIKYDSTTTESSAAHGGTGWEQMTVSVDIPYTLTTLDAGLTCSSGTQIAFYVDEAVMWIGRYPAHSSWTPLFNARQRGRTLYFDYSLADNKPIRLVGLGYLSTASADTSEIEIDEPQTALLYAWARVYLYSQLLASMPVGQRGPYEGLLGYYEGKLEQAKRQHSMSLPPAQPKIVGWRS